MKTYLNSYNSKDLAGFFTNGDSVYELNVTEVSWWGLKKKNKTIDYILRWDQDDMLVFEHWEGLINSETPIPIKELKWYDYITTFFVLLFFAIYMFCITPICWAIAILILLILNN